MPLAETWLPSLKKHALLEGMLIAFSSAGAGHDLGHAAGKL
jgi:hypothetical protein